MEEARIYIERYEASVERLQSRLQVSKTLPSYCGKELLLPVLGLQSYPDCMYITCTCGTCDVFIPCDVCCRCWSS